MNKLFIRTMGCQMNEYDSEKMLAILKNSHNLSQTLDEKTADVLTIENFLNSESSKVAINKP